MESQDRLVSLQKEQGTERSGQAGQGTSPDGLQGLPRKKKFLWLLAAVVAGIGLLMIGIWIGIVISQTRARHEIEQEKTAASTITVPAVGVSAGEQEQYDAASEFYKYFISGTWVINDDYVSLELVPRDWIYSVLSEAKKDTRWIAVYNYFYTDKAYWSNTSGMRDQFMCHANHWWIINKKIWYLEPERPDKPPAILYLCNPI